MPSADLTDTPNFVSLFDFAGSTSRLFVFVYISKYVAPVPQLVAKHIYFFKFVNLQHLYLLFPAYKLKRATQGAKFI